MNLCNRNRITDRERNRITDVENKLVVAKGEGVGGGMEWEAGVSRRKLLYIEWINNRSYCIAQGTAIVEKSIYKIRECICICITESLCCTAEINTTL